MHQLPLGPLYYEFSRHNEPRLRIKPGEIGAQTALGLEESARQVQAMHDAGKRINKEIFVLCHGGPIAEPADAQYILDHRQGVVGFYGASSMERLPVEPAIRERVREFTELRFKAGP